MVFLDTNIIIYLSKGTLDIGKVIDENEEYAISVITYMEILGYPFETKQEELFIKEILSLFDVVFITDDVVLNVIIMRKEIKIKLPDAIICATCISLNSPLITNDLKLQNIEQLKLKLIS